MKADEVRTVRGSWSAAKAARVAGVSASTWRHWERSVQAPRTESVQKIMQVARARMREEMERRRLMAELEGARGEG